MITTTTTIHIAPSLSMTFQPEAWNDHAIISKTNCLAYALDCPAAGFPFLRSVFPTSTLHKQLDPTVVERLKASSVPHIKLLFAGLSRIREHEHSPDTHHIIAYSPAMAHFFRLDGDRTWSHKQGATEATNRDAKDNPITNLEAADFAQKYYDSRAFYLSTQQTIEDVRKDCLYPAHVKQELIQRQRQMMKSCSPSDPARKKIIYLALPKEGIVVVPGGLA